MKRTRRIPLTTIVTLALIVTLLVSCSTGDSSRNPTGSPEEAIAVTEAAAKSLERSLLRIQSLEPGQSFEFHASDEEVTSYLALRYPDAFLRDARVRFSAGGMGLRARMTNPIRVKVEIDCHIQIAEQRPKVDFQLVKLGSLRLPGFLRRSLSKYVNEAIATAPVELAITDLQLLEGQLLVSGYRPA